MSAPAPKPSIKIRLGGPKDMSRPSSAGDVSSGARKSTTPGVIVDAKALERQQQHVQASINGIAAPVSSSEPQPSVTANVPSGNNDVVTIRPPSSAASPPALTNGVKVEGQNGQSTPDPVRPTSAKTETTDDKEKISEDQPVRQSSTSSMPPPPGPIRPTSISPHPSQPSAQPQPQVNMTLQRLPNNSFDNKLRVEGKGEFFMHLQIQEPLPLTYRFHRANTFDAYGFNTSCLEHHPRIQPKHLSFTESTSAFSYDNASVDAPLPPDRADLTRIVIVQTLSFVRYRERPSGFRDPSLRSGQGQYATVVRS
jgi:hypothetical protein